MEEGRFTAVSIVAKREYTQGINETESKHILCYGAASPSPPPPSFGVLCGHHGRNILPHSWGIYRSMIVGLSILGVLYRASNYENPTHPPPGRFTVLEHQCCSPSWAFYWNIIVAPLPGLFIGVSLLDYPSSLLGRFAGV